MKHTLLTAILLTLVAITIVGIAYRYLPHLFVATGLSGPQIVWVALLTGAALGGLLIALLTSYRRRVNAGQ